VKGSNPKIDESIAKIDKLNNFLKQGIDDSIQFEESTKLLEAIISA